MVNQIDDAAKLADTVAAHLAVKIPEKQELLEMPKVATRLEKVFQLMEGEISVSRSRSAFVAASNGKWRRTQREYYLNEQLKAIQKELGEGEDGRDELNEIEERIKKAKLSDEAREKSMAELKKLRQMSPMSAEATVVRNYLDWILSLPWGKRSKIKKDLLAAETVLNEDHYGLEKVKERILEYLAVQQRTNKLRGPILCLVGPPGVGKTSLGKSVAKATGREFVRMSLGGVRDEAEIRGHRRTYIGSMPGKIIQSMKKAKSGNPLILLDEIDKLGAGFPRRPVVGSPRGLGPRAERDVRRPLPRGRVRPFGRDVHHHGQQLAHAATADGPHGDHPHSGVHGKTRGRDRQAALDRQADRSARIEAEEWQISDSAIRDLIRYHTREAGVRNLEREFANLTRKAVRDIVSGQDREDRDYPSATSANMPASGASATARRRRRMRSASSTVSLGPRSVAISCRSKPSCCLARAACRQTASSAT